MWCLIVSIPDLCPPSYSEKSQQTTTKTCKNYPACADLNILPQNIENVLPGKYKVSSMPACVVVIGLVITRGLFIISSSQYVSSSGFTLEHVGVKNVILPNQLSSELNATSTRYSALKAMSVSFNLG